MRERETRKMIKIGEIRCSLIEHINFVQEKMRELERADDLTIHEMADLERYSSTLKNLADTYKDLG